MELKLFKRDKDGNIILTDIQSKKLVAEPEVPVSDEDSTINNDNVVSEKSDN